MDPVTKIINDIHDIDALIIESSVTGNLVTVNDIKSNDIRNLGKTRKNSLTVGITKTALNIILFVKFRIDSLLHIKLYRESSLHYRSIIEIGRQKVLYIHAFSICPAFSVSKDITHMHGFSRIVGRSIKVTEINRIKKFIQCSALFIPI